MDPKRLEMDDLQYHLDTLRLDDLDHIQSIVETWARSWLRVVDGRVRGTVITSEVDEIIERVQASLTDSSIGSFYVLRGSDGIPVGMAGLAPVDPRMMQFTQTERPIEMTNVYLDNAYRGQGLGRQLVDSVLDTARESGYTEVVWNSGPRFKDTAWGFYERVYGPQVGTAEKYYDDKWDAPVWSVFL